jgi:hypothetical protein
VRQIFNLPALLRNSAAPHPAISLGPYAAPHRLKVCVRGGGARDRGGGARDKWLPENGRAKWLPENGRAKRRQENGRATL